MGSDVKRTTYGNCVLCGQHAQLELGHVVPRWAGKWIKDEGFVLGKYDSIGVHTRSQDIEKHYMMCRTCENYLGVAEGYLASVVRGTSGDLAARGITLHREANDVVRLDNINADIMLRSVLGILLKAHLSPHHIYRHVRLPRWALTEVHNALQSDVYPHGRLSVLALKIMNLTVPDANPRARIDAQLRNVPGGVGAILRFGGFVFVVHVGAVNRSPLGKDMKSMQSGDRSMWVGVGEFSYEPGIVPDEGGVEVPRIAGRYVSVTDRCPCGLDSSFAQCCQGRWLPSRARYLDVPNKETRHMLRGEA